jgi:hypothetical protein|tara:strand:+ start:368 stop:535 length:168 start_codon:yes stop_codon:yes gene_type:complete
MEKHMNREQMIRELIDNEGYRGNSIQGVQQIMKYAHMTDLELAKVWLKRVRQEII